MPNIFSFYRIALLVAFPLGIAAHGAFWVLDGTSFAPAVYAMKLVFIPFLILAIAAVWRDLYQRKWIWVYCAFITPLFVISLVAPLALESAYSRFYYVADFLGIGVTLSAVGVAYLLFERGLLRFSDLERVSSAYLVIISIYILVFFFASGGDKISVTPEMFFPMALVVGAYLVPVPGGYQPPFWIIPLTALACAVSLLRENLILFVIFGVICMARGLLYGIEWRRMALYVLSAVLVVFITPDLIVDRLQTFQFGLGQPIVDGLRNRESGLGQVPTFVDASANQRIVEVKLMYQEMFLRPWSFLFGQGFGATYYNDGGALVYYDERVHNAHSTPFLIYFRNGLYGLLLYAIPISLAAFSIFRRSEIVFRASLCVVSVYAALMVNQYLYWSVPIGVSIALLFYSRSSRHRDVLHAVH